MGGPPLLIQGNVGPATGSVCHCGDVRIAGNLRTGGRVRADGDLHITGHVTSAKAEASGNLIVDGIASGTDTLLDAIGEVTAYQAVDATILAGGNISILTAAERCQLYAGGEILLCGMPGLLRGGIARAGNRVVARRIEAGGRDPARIEIGGRVFHEDAEELEEKLALVRKQTVQGILRSGDSPATYRRSLASLKAFRKLGRILDHRARQLRALTRSDSPVLIVTGDQPVFAELRLGPDGTVVETPPHGPFEFGLTTDGVECTSPGEVACEQ